MPAYVTLFGLSLRLALSILLLCSSRSSAQHLSGSDGADIVIVGMDPESLFARAAVRLQLARLVRSDGQERASRIDRKDIEDLLQSGLYVEIGGKRAKILRSGQGTVDVLVPRDAGSLSAEHIFLAIDSVRSPSYAETRDIPSTVSPVRQTESVPLYITGVVPRVSFPDSALTILLSGDIVLPSDSDEARLAPNWLTVTIGDKRASVVKMSRSAIVVDVPPGLPSGDSVPVIVDAGTRRTPRYRGLSLVGDAVQPGLLIPTEPAKKTSLRWPWLVGLVIGVLVGVTYALGRRRQRHLEVLLAEAYANNARIERRPVADSSPPDSAPGEEVADVPTPEPPQALIEACAAGTCILFVGAGLSVAAGYPAWSETLRTLVERFGSESRLRGSSQPRQDLRVALKEGRETAVTDLLIARTPRDVLLAEIERLYPAEAHPVSRVAELLADIPFDNVITTGWDDILERAFAERSPMVVYSSSPDGVAALLHEDAFCIVRLFGSPQEPGSMLLTQGEYREVLIKNPILGKHLASLLLSRTHLFVGVTPADIESYFGDHGESYRSSKQHFALVPASAQLDLDAERLEGKYHTVLLPYDPGGGDGGQLVQALGQLRDAVRPRVMKGARAGLRQAVLEEVHLLNIGPFKQLRLQLGDKWNVFLGNNGSGKSTLLKAIALGLCGDDEKAAFAGEQLLRADESKGEVVLVLGGVHYRTELVRTGSRVHVICRQVTPLLAGQSVVLGFPPLRGMATGAPRGPGQDGSPIPVVDDLLPMISGEPDRRLENLRQWIVNIEVRSNPTTGVSEAQAKQNAALRRRFFSLLNDFTPGIEVEFEDVNMQSWVVRVKTADGKVPIEQLSQGMMSVYAWVGTLLQRMFEIYANSPDPTREAALVLVDEVDAHLHPEWQQQLVGLLKDRFPALQVVATTHSPLVVAGMNAGEVKIVIRESEDPSTISILPPPVEFSGMRADQILTSPLFGLLTTRSRGVRRDIDRYSVLLGNLSRTEAEEQEFQGLRAKLNPVLAVGETKLERRVEEAVEAAMSQLTPEKLIGEAIEHKPVQVTLEIKRQLAELFGREAPKP